MKLISKPEGFDLRDRRSDKTGKGSDWTVADAVYSAHKDITATKSDAVMVVWRQLNDDGSTTVRFSFSGPPDAGAALLLNAVGRYMSWQR